MKAEIVHFKAGEREAAVSFLAKLKKENLLGSHSEVRQEMRRHHPDRKKSGSTEEFLKIRDFHSILKKRPNTGKLEVNGKCLVRGLKHERFNGRIVTIVGRAKERFMVRFPKEMVDVNLLRFPKGAAVELRDLKNRPELNRGMATIKGIAGPKIRIELQDGRQFNVDSKHVGSLSHRVVKLQNLSSNDELQGRAVQVLKTENDGKVLVADTDGVTQYR